MNNPRASRDSIGSSMLPLLFPVAFIMPSSLIMPCRMSLGDKHLPGLQIICREPADSDRCSICPSDHFLETNGVWWEPVHFGKT